MDDYVIKALEEIDFSKQHIALWLPPTSYHDLRESYVQAMQMEFGREVSISLVDYPANWNLSESQPLGVEILKTVLLAIKEKAPESKVYLAGESQGSWVIGDALNEPKYKDLVDRAVMMGHPSVAKYHYEDEEKILEINHPHDPYTEKPMVEQDLIIETISILLSKPNRVAVKNFLKNTYPNLSLLTRMTIIGLLEARVLPNRLLHNTHRYDEYMPLVAKYFRTGEALEIKYIISKFRFVRSYKTAR